MKHFGIFLARCAAVLALSSLAQANDSVAVLSDAHGKVLVNQGDGFVPASVDIVLKPSDKLLVGKDASATVSYESCAVVLAETALFTVTPKAPCAAGQNLANFQGVMILPSAGEETISLLGLEMPLEVGVGILLVGGAVVVGGVAAGIYAYRENEEPISGF
jgi:hypothetical protein